MNCKFVAIVSNATLLKLWNIRVCIMLNVSTFYTFNITSSGYYVQRYSIAMIDHRRGVMNDIKVAHALNITKTSLSEKIDQQFFVETNLMPCEKVRTINAMRYSSHHTASSATTFLHDGSQIRQFEIRKSFLSP